MEKSQYLKMLVDVSQLQADEEAELVSREGQAELEDVTQLAVWGL